VDLIFDVGQGEANSQGDGEELMTVHGERVEEWSMEPAVSNSQSGGGEE